MTNMLTSLWEQFNLSTPKDQEGMNENVDNKNDDNIQEKCILCGASYDKY